jgi:hypothetical protein
MASERGLEQQAHRREHPAAGVTLQTMILWDIVAWLVVFELVWWLT